MTDYYNEFDPYAADCLENLIRDGLIPHGIVDRRSIEDVAPSDLADFNRCHFFAGIGGWALALSLAGWTDRTRRLWTGSCPCQPFSAAGAGGGFDDERHLWPHFHWLIDKCRPEIVLGEQVASKDGLGWFDLVSSDLEGSGYAQAAVDLCAAGFSAAHIRQRLYWIGVEHGAGHGRHERRAKPGGRGVVSGCGNHRPHAIDGDWRVADWLWCRDEKFRPVEPGTFPLVDGLPAGLGTVDAGIRRMAEMAGLDGSSLRRAKSYRTGALKGYGNALDIHTAAEFCHIVKEVIQS